MNSKKSGMSLLETMFAVSLLSILLVGLYKTYTMIQRSALWSQHASIYSKKIAQCTHIIQQDFSFINFHYLVHLFQSAFDLSKKKDEMFNKNKKNESSPKPETKDDKKEKEKEKNEKKFMFCKKYLPQAYQENDDTVISFITSYALLTSLNNPSGISKVSYRLKKNGELFELRREEEIFDPTKKDDTPKKSTSYVLLDKIKNAEFVWYIPDISGEILKESKKAEENEDIIQKKLSNLTFINQSILDTITPDLIIEKNIYPAGVHFKGEYEIQKNTFIPFDIFFALPNYTFYLEYYLYFIEELHKEESKQSTTSQANSNQQSSIQPPQPQAQQNTISTIQ